MAFKPGVRVYLGPGGAAAGVSSSEKRECRTLKASFLQGLWSKAPCRPFALERLAVRSQIHFWRAAGSGGGLGGHQR